MGGAPYLLLDIPLCCVHVYGYYRYNNCCVCVCMCVNVHLDGWMYGCQSFPSSEGGCPRVATCALGLFPVYSRGWMAGG